MNAVRIRPRRSRLFPRSQSRCAKDKLIERKSANTQRAYRGDIKQFVVHPVHIVLAQDIAQAHKIRKPHDVDRKIS